MDIAHRINLGAMLMPKKVQPGFTIVELLVVIVVIAILAGISISAYTGIQGRAHNSIVQSELKNIAKMFEIYRLDNGVYPAGTAQLTPLKISVTKGSYGAGFASNAHNLLYCRVAASGPDKFALMASSRSGNVYVYKSETGSVEQISSWPSGGSTENCNSVGINQTISSDRDIFYYNSAWMSYIAG